jgi:hypothetical protein
MKFLTLITIVCIILIDNRAKAQEFHEFKVQALDGSNQKVILIYNDSKELLKLSCLNDTLYIPGVIYLDSTMTLDNRFLFIKYGAKGGSGLNLKHTLLLSVKNNKLYQSLHITSVFDEEFIDFSKKVDVSNPVDVKTVYESTLNLLGNDIQTYKLYIEIHESKMSKQHPSQNYSANRKFALNFDRDKNIFFTSKEDLSQYFNVFDEKDLRESKQYFMGKLPVIKLGNFKYYYANNRWYENQQAGYLIQYTYQ